MVEAISFYAQMINEGFKCVPVGHSQRSCDAGSVRTSVLRTT